MKRDLDAEACEWSSTWECVDYCHAFASVYAFMFDSHVELIDVETGPFASVGCFDRDEVPGLIKALQEFPGKG